jgi:hypothetical protein
VTGNAVTENRLIEYDIEKAVAGIERLDLAPEAADALRTNPRRGDCCKRSAWP